MLHMEVTEPIPSTSAAPVILVPKRNGFTHFSIETITVYTVFQLQLHILCLAS